MAVIVSGTISQEEHGYRSYEDDVAKISISIYVSNLPETFSAKDLFHACNKYGHVIDSFIPLKRSKEANDLSCVAIGKIKDINALSNLSVILNDEGFDDIKISYLGGYWVLIQSKFVLPKRIIINHAGQQCTISDYFVAVRGTWLSTATKVMFVSIYAPQDISEKKCLHNEGVVTERFLLKGAFLILTKVTSFRDLAQKAMMGVVLSISILDIDEPCKKLSLSRVDDLGCSMLRFCEDQGRKAFWIAEPINRRYYFKKPLGLALNEEEGFQDVFRSAMGSILVTGIDLMIRCPVILIFYYADGRKLKSSLDIWDRAKPPSYHRRIAWDEIIGKVSNRLSKWKIKTLSVGGRLTLIKSVTYGPCRCYHMSLYKAPLGVLRDLEFLRRKFFNGADINEKRFSMISWNKILASKQKGGLELNSVSAKGINLLALLKKESGERLSRKHSLFGKSVGLMMSPLADLFPRVYALEDQ
ncbi:RNA-directed DNA polymerase, eukaryota [Tanacetum coccineum]